MGEEKEIEAQVLRQMHARSDALVRKDVPALQHLLADEFVYINASGMVLTKSEYLRLYIQGQEMVWSAQELDEVQVQVYGDMAVVMCRVHDIARVRGEPFDEYFLSTLVWVKREGEWRCVAGQTTATERPASE